MSDVSSSSKSQSTYTAGDVASAGGLSSEVQQLLTKGGVSVDEMTEFDSVLDGVSKKMSTSSNEKASSASPTQQTTLNAMSLQPGAPEKSESPYFQPSLMAQIRKLLMVLLSLMQEMEKDMTTFQQKQIDLVTESTKTKIESIQDKTTANINKNVNAATMAMTQAITSGVSAGFAAMNAIGSIAGAAGNMVGEGAGMLASFVPGGSGGGGGGSALGLNIGSSGGFSGMLDKLSPGNAAQKLAGGIKFLSAIPQKINELAKPFAEVAQKAGDTANALAQQAKEMGDAAANQLAGEAEMQQAGADMVLNHTSGTISEMRSQMQEVFQSMNKALDLADKLSGEEKQRANWRA